MSNPAATGGGENQTLGRLRPAGGGGQAPSRRGGASPASDAGAAAQLELQSAFAPGGAESSEVVEAEETPVPSTPAARHDGPLSTRVLAKPPVRKLAKDLGVDLRALTPSGPEGTVTRADVHAAARAAWTRPRRSSRQARCSAVSGRPASRSRACAR